MEDLDLFKDLLEDDEETEEEKQSRKNKDAEEARKRREAEEKAKAEKEAKDKEEAEKKAKAEAEAKAKAEAEAKAKAEADKKAREDQNGRTTKLGEQLKSFSEKHPEIDLKELDKDVAFKKFIDGKLLGKKDFSVLYEEYLEVKKELSGKTQQEIEENYRRKAGSSAGSAGDKSGGGSKQDDVYTEAELEALSSKIPLMSDAEYKKIEEKLKKSTNFYKAKK